MNKGKWPTVIAGGIVVVVLAVAFVLSQGGANQAPVSNSGSAPTVVAVPGSAPAVERAVEPALAPVVASSGAAAPPGPGVEGIKVSGHWTIEVREPDGRLVSRQEFENALGTTGAESLARFLARDKTPGLWYIPLPGVDPACLGVTGASIACYIGESASTSTAPYMFKNLQVSLTPDFKVRLSGTATAQKNGDITAVFTRLDRCASSYAPSAPCTSASGMDFTSKTLATPVSVILNQQVVVTVDISFN